MLRTKLASVTRISCRLSHGLLAPDMTVNGWEQIAWKGVSLGVECGHRQGSRAKWSVPLFSYLVTSAAI